MTDLNINVFFADLHHPGGVDEEIEQLFQEMPAGANRLFFLGDIFHYWINDPSFIEDRYAHFLKRLEGMARDGMQIFFLEGNRDFLASHYLDRQPWVDVLVNPTVIDLAGRAVYIGHGDELCWNDWAYQLFKGVIRSKPLRAIADRAPSAWKQKAVRRMADASEKIVASKTQSTLAVPQRAYEQVVSTGIDVIIHGHIHDTYQRVVKADNHEGTIYSFGWKNGKRNLIHFEG
ncbi:MAG: metallophosphoesterase [Candidatus Hinthialibacter antarcticus]|nr:metallophosphoesterase [Candidatus Hinthialibacter antarcticus]